MVNNMNNNILEIKHLSISFFNSHKKECVTPASDISFSIPRGQTLCIVGESGCGKSVTSQAIMKLFDKRNTKISGTILFEGIDLSALSSKEMLKYRGADISMIFQEPMTALNPSRTVGWQLSEVLKIHKKSMTSEEMKAVALERLAQVGIPDPERCYQSYPHQLSGGMRQRAMIAMALMGHPKLLIADEPTTALDVTIQAQILDLIRKIKSETNMTVLLITHDLGIVAEMADQVLVMYAGKIVESASVSDLFAHPAHPYTKGLLSCIPRLDTSHTTELFSIPGQVPSPRNFPQGCRFHPRCPHASDQCTRQAPELLPYSGEHLVACHHSL